MREFEEILNRAEEKAPSPKIAYECAKAVDLASHKGYSVDLRTCFGIFQVWAKKNRDLLPEPSNQAPKKGRPRKKSRRK